MTRLRQVILEYLWLLAFLFLVLPVVTAEGQQGPPAIIAVDTTLTQGALVNPSLPRISEYRPPAIYIEWVRAVAACEGLPFPEEKFRRVQFFQVNARDFYPPRSDDAAYAATFATAYSGQVYVAYPLIWNRQIIGHEALHLLLYWSGDRKWYEHDYQRFTSCGLAIGGEPIPN